MKSGLVIASVVSVLLVLSAQAGATKPQPMRVKYMPSPVRTLAFDRSRVAYVSNGKVYVWNVATGATSVIRGTYATVGRPKVPAYALTIDHEVAIAGTRVAFVTRYVNNGGELTDLTHERLYVAPVGGWAHRVGPVFSSALPASGAGGVSGTLSAGPIGSGNLLALSTWSSDYDTKSDEALQLITPSGLQTITTGPGAIVAESASNGRIAVLVSSAFPPTVRIYSSTGAFLSELAPSAAREIALSGSRLVVLTWKNTVDVYDWSTGDLLHTWPVATVPPGARTAHLAVYGRLAVYAIDSGYATPRTLRLLDLETGRDVAVVRARGGGRPGGTYRSTNQDAAMNRHGLVYIVNYTPRAHPREVRGKLVFVPMAKLVARLG